MCLYVYVYTYIVTDIYLYDKLNIYNIDNNIFACVFSLYKCLSRMCLFLVLFILFHVIRYNKTFTKNCCFFILLVNSFTVTISSKVSLQMLNT